MKSVYVYDKTSKSMIPKYEAKRDEVHTIMADLADFVSPIDGKVVHGRRGYREHCKQHKVTNPADFTNHWAKFQKEREALFTGKERDVGRKQAVVRAFNELQERNRNKRW